MVRPTLVQDVADRLAVALHGGVRVRVLEDGGGVVRGRTAGPPPARLLRAILDLAPAGAGTIDLRHDGRGRWHVRARGELASPRFEQRLRNLLGNALA